ncbi:gliding motility lipoprotein GldB [Hymenobacter jeollabukensis]|uniref:Gliding motility lipoprotein GldB n=1 Tax=Hymenobacter jeollabukensis TaxID=2025313 RepID=A0A5R8WUQ7_9BACT|nr:gliding motility lipoprotein GldB [Hymenobacter jeollabukensis]TLM95512.1 gliding motility lipoprotein GldB [Hymenobacter jeollabukensis]
MRFPRLHSWLSLPALATLLLLQTACSRDEKSCEMPADVAAVQAPVQLQRLEKPFFQIRTPADAKQFMDREPLFARYFLQRPKYPSDEVLQQTLVKLATNPGLQKLGQQADSTFQNAEQWQGNLQRMFQYVRYYFPDFKVPQAKTFVSGLSQDIFVNDSLLVISTDFFVGPKAVYLPNVPAYIQRRYRPEYVLPTVALAVSSKYNKKALTATTTLAEMIQNGKALYFAEKVLPCADDSLLIGFSAKDLENVHFNEAKIWGHFLQKNLLYDTNPFLIQKYVGERPNVPEIDKTCPGRVGQWVGWQIVRKYMADNPKVTLAQLMATKDAQRILSDSHYRPRK